ncbi:MAG: ATP-binding cassette domain-containing protein [Clostridiales bacterium]|nr:ATP-binding cassette domain-containing protein [Clostridiales bacterium]
MIKVKDVTKQYNGVNVVDRVSVDIEKGKITSFIGPNGAGKSTLLSMISRLITKNGGDILIDDQKLEHWDNSQLAQKISILNQSNYLNIRLTVRELVGFGRFPYSKGNLTDADERFIDEAIGYMQLESMEHRYLDELSGGQRQRAYIAMVIAQDTDYILLDEPLNNLDMRHSVEIMKILRGLVNDLGKTIVIVIHDINFASCYSDYIVALKDGKVAAEGNIEKIIDKHVLNEIYDIDFTIQDIEDMRVCVYF